MCRYPRDTERLGEAGKDPSLESLEEHGQAVTLISNFWPPELRQNKTSAVLRHLCVLSPFSRV